MLNPAPAAARKQRRATRYSALGQLFHWVSALLMFAVLPLAWAMIVIARDNPNRETLYTIHKSIGVTILALTALRLGWRAVHPAPPLPASMAVWEKFLARASHWALYAAMVLMPASGYVLSSAGGHPVSYFGLFTLPALPQNRALAQAADWVHVMGQWAVYALIVLHVAATVFHLLVRRDGVLDRMLPAQTNAEGA